MRLIDADKLGIGKANPDIFENKEYAHGWNSAIQIINDAPTIDAVPVVRCEDCRYYGNTKKHKRCGECTNYNRIAYPDEFCSYGERRKDK